MENSPVANTLSEQHPEENDDVALLEARQLLADSERQLSEIEDAIGSLAEGSYGRCERCGALIEAAVLARLPGHRRCALHEVD